MDKIVSVRLSKKLVKELNSLVNSSGFLDVSELIRYIIRKKYFEFTKPIDYRIESLREELLFELDKKLRKATKLEVLKELSKILEDIEKKQK